MPAKTFKELKGQGLSLYLFKYPGGLKAMLYDGRALLADVLTGLENFEKADEALTKGAHPPDVAYGMIVGKLNPTCKAFEVEMAAAQRGYGPFMYDVAGSIFKWIMSDRLEVSRDALSVWEWMFRHPEAYDKRYVADPAEPEPFELGATEENPCVPNTEEDALLYAYRPKGDKKARTKALVNNHKKVVKKLLEKGIQGSVVNDWFANAAEDLFRDKY